MRRFVVCALVGLAASSAWGEMVWDFNDGLQGWNIVNSGTNTGKWVAPGETQLLYTNYADIEVYSNAGGGNLYLPGDGNGGTTAVFDLSNHLVGGKTQSFTLQADVWIPNLRPLTGFPWGYPGMINQYSGISAYAINNGANNDYGIHVGGRADKSGQLFVDYTSDSWIQHRGDWVMEEKNNANVDTWWDQWITLKLDWNSSSPGNVIASAYIPWESYVSQPGWVTLYDGPIEPTTWFTNPREINRIGLGSFLKGDTPWSKSQIDNVIFNSPDLIPEPSSLLLLALGAAGLVGGSRRRK